MNIKHEGTAGKKMNFWNLVFENEKMDGKWTDLPLQNIPLPSLDNPSFPRKSKIFWPPPNGQNYNSYNHLSGGVGGAHYATPAKASNKVF